MYRNPFATMAPAPSPAEARTIIDDIREDNEEITDEDRVTIPKRFLKSHEISRRKLRASVRTFAHNLYTTFLLLIVWARRGAISLLFLVYEGRF